MTYEENIRSILKCCFFQTKEEIIETAVTAIMALDGSKGVQPVIIPDTRPVYPTYPYNPVIYSDGTGISPEPNKTIQITCENLNNKEN